MTQPSDGQWYQASDNNWYCWPNPTPHAAPPLPPPPAPLPPPPVAQAITVPEPIAPAFQHPVQQGPAAPTQAWAQPNVFPTHAQVSSGPLWKKKRVYIPAALVVIAIIGNATSSGGKKPLDASKAASDSSVSTKPAGGQTAAQKAAASKAAAAKTGASKAAAAKAAAAKAAAAKAAAARATATKAKYAGAMGGDKVAAPGQPVELSGWTTTASKLYYKSDGFGGKNLCTNITLVNRDKDQQDYSPLSWKLQLPSGNVLDTTYSGDSNELDSASLAPGGHLAALVCFEDKKAGPGQYVLAWQPDVFTSEDRGVWLNRL